jgi:ribosomal protein L24E
MMTEQNLNKSFEPIGGRCVNCPICGKEFTSHDGWVFRRKSGGHQLTFCSWKCLRKFEADHPPKRKIDKREKIIQAISDGLNDREIAAMLNEPIGKVQYWRDRTEGLYERETGSEGCGETD